MPVITLKLQVNGKEISETLKNTDHPGIYSFNIKPETSGKGQLLYEISSPAGNYQVVVPDITVFRNRGSRTMKPQKLLRFQKPIPLFLQKNSHGKLISEQNCRLASHLDR